MKRMVFIRCLLVLPVLFVAAVGNLFATAAAEGAAPTTNKLVIIGRNRVIAEPNYTDSWLEEQIGVELQWITKNGADFENTLALLIASGDIPDIIGGIRDRIAYYQYVEDGLFHPDFEQLLRQHGPNLLAARTDDQIERNRWSDGNIYVIADNVTGNWSGQIMHLHWLRALGLDVPTTIDELTNVVRAFTLDDPDGNGKNDTYGFGGLMGGNYIRTFGLNMIYPAFGCDTFAWSVQGNGQLEHGTVQTECLEALRYMRMLYEEGYLDPEFATINDWGKWTEISANQRWGTYYGGIQDVEESQRPELYKLPGTDIDIIEPVRGPGGKGMLVHWNPGGVGLTGIYSKTNDPVTAMKVLNFIADEDNYARIRNGVEGVHYDIDPALGGVRYRGEWQDHSTRVQAGITATYAMPFLPHDPPYIQYSKKIARGFEIRERNLPYADFYDAVPAVAERGLGATLDDIADAEFARMILATDDIDEMWRAFVQRWMDSDGKVVTELTQQYWASLGN